MKYIINLEIIQGTKKYFLSINEDIGVPELYSVNLYVTSDLKLSDVLSKKNVLKMLKEEYERLQLDFDYEGISIIKKIMDSDLDIINNYKYIMVDSNEKVSNYINNNPIIEEKKIVISELLCANKYDYNRINKLFGKYKNVYVYIDGNNSKVSLADYEKTINALDEIIKKIKKYDLSPLEQIMYAYDLVRSRVYTSESKTESSGISRDLTKVLLGDKIVCVGYANIFANILSNIGIKSIICDTMRIDKTGCHQRNIVYVEDDKYDIEGVFYFDATWDSKKKDDNQSYLNSYKYFCRSRQEIDKINEGKYADKTFKDYHETTALKFCLEFLNKGIDYVPREIIKAINQVANFIDNKKLIDPVLMSSEVPSFLQEQPSSEEIMDRLSYYQQLFFSSELGYRTLLQLAYNVRKIEYYENPTKYPFTEECFKKIIENNPFPNSSELKKDIERVKLTRTLKKILSKKVTDNSY